MFFLCSAAAALERTSMRYCLLLFGRDTPGEARRTWGSRQHLLIPLLLFRLITSTKERSSLCFLSPREEGLHAYACVPKEGVLLREELFHLTCTKGFFSFYFWHPRDGRLWGDKDPVMATCWVMIWVSTEGAEWLWIWVHPIDLKIRSKCCIKVIKS